MTIKAKTPKELFLASIQKNSRTPFTWDDIQVSSVQSQKGAMGTNTTVQLAADPKGRYNGVKSIRVIRLDINSVLHGVEVVIDPKDFYNAVELLPDLNRLYGIALNHDDVVNIKLPRKYPADIVLQMAPNNLALTGELKISLRETGKDIGSAFFSDVLGDPVFDGYVPNVINADKLYLAFDFSSMADELSSLNTGPGHAYTVQNILAHYFDTEWTVVASMNDFNLYGCVVVAAKVDEGRRKYVEIKLNKNYCRNVVGSLFLYYRDIL